MAMTKIKNAIKDYAKLHDVKIYDRRPMTRSIVSPWLYIELSASYECRMYFTPNHYIFRCGYSYSRDFYHYVLKMRYEKHVDIDINDAAFSLTNWSKHKKIEKSAFGTRSYKYLKFTGSLNEVLEEYKNYVNLLKYTCKECKCSKLTGCDCLYVRRIQRAWREAISNPAYALCQQRLKKEFTEFSI